MRRRLIEIAMRRTLRILPESLRTAKSVPGRTMAAAVTAVAIAVAVPFTFAQPLAYGNGPGMMGGYGGYGNGPGMMGGYGGYGNGPGMMGGYGGYGMGPGMMGGYGGYGMGPGMMGGYGGYGMGPGMMGGYGGYGMGPGMYGPHGLGALDLSDEQREKLAKIQEGVADKHWQLMGQIREQNFKLRDQLASGNADDAAVGKTLKSIESLREQMWSSGLDAWKQVDGVLTKSQREQLQRFRRPTTN